MWPEEMLKKTALRRLSKLLPSARDYMDEGERPEIELTATPTIGAEDLPRITRDVPDVSTTRGALDHFAGGGGHDQINQETGEIASDTKQSEPEPEPKTPPSTPEVAPPTEPDDAIGRAYRGGKNARADGMQRRAMPGEYRTNDRQKEAAAWLAGFDGAAMPTSPPDSML